MHFAIIAAGEGSRLREEGIQEPKPLVPIQGQPMIDRLMAVMVRCGAESISVICNSAMPEVCRHLEQVKLDVPLHLIESQTPSSMHSLALLSHQIPEGKVIVTTVDTIFREADFAAYVDAFRHSDDSLFAVTPFVDDEKPLWITLSSHDASPYPAITSLTDARPSVEDPVVSGGIYGFDTRTAWPVLHRCISEGQFRMRNFQRALLASGVAIRACVFDHIMDIDHASDVAKANAWLGGARRILAVGRAPQHSPNNVASDAAILDAVTALLRAEGCEVRRVSEDDLQSLPKSVEDDFDAVCHMARCLPSLARLSRLKIPVVNRPDRVMSVAHSREYTLSLLHEAGVEVPEWWAYDPDDDRMFQCDEELRRLLPGWVKATRSDGAQPDDVLWVQTPLEADSRIIELAAQQVPDIVVTRHVEGDLLKVYCVVDDVANPEARPWLRTRYPQATGYSKFGRAEQHNSPLQRTPFSESRLSDLTLAIARTLGLQVFGFDAIVRPDGSLVVIDVNDWPSFSSCLDEAAQAIAQVIRNQ